MSDPSTIFETLRLLLAEILRGKHCRQKKVDAVIDLLRSEAGGELSGCIEKVDVSRGWQIVAVVHDQQEPLSDVVFDD